MKIKLFVYVIIFMLLSACNNINQRYNVSAGDDDIGKSAKTEIVDLSKQKKGGLDNIINNVSQHALLESGKPCWITNKDNLKECQSLSDGFKMFYFVVASMPVSSFQIEPSEKQIEHLKSKARSNNKISLLDYYYHEQENQLYGLIKIFRNDNGSKLYQKHSINNLKKEHTQVEDQLKDTHDKYKKKNSKGEVEIIDYKISQ